MKLGDNHFGGEQGVYCPPLLTPPWETGAEAEGGCMREGDRSVLLAWWPVWGDPASAIVGMRNLLARGPKELLLGDRGDLGELAGKP